MKVTWTRCTPEWNRQLGTRSALLRFHCFVRILIGVRHVHSKAVKSVGEDSGSLFNMKKKPLDGWMYALHWSIPRSRILKDTQKIDSCVLCFQMLWTIWKDNALNFTKVKIGKTRPSNHGQNYILGCFVVLVEKEPFMRCTRLYFGEPRSALP